MPKNKKKKYLEEYVYSKSVKVDKPKTKKSYKFFIFLFSIVTICILVFLANIFSNFITPSTLNLNKGERYFLGQTLYAVELATFDNIAEANTSSEQYKSQLAAGYIVNDKGVFRILASVYKTKSNASSVVENLKANSIDANIYEISMPTLYMDLDLEEEQKTALKECLNLFYNAYLTLYNLSIALDKSEKTTEQCEIEIMSLANSCKTSIDNLNAELEIPKIAQIIYTKIYLNTFLDDLEELKATSTTSSTYSSKIKETYFKVIYNYIHLKTELAKN